MKQRVATFDIMKGIAIILMLVGHWWAYFPRWLMVWVYSFHMPLFFLLAGYFHKESADNNLVVKKSFNRLVVPFLAVLAVCFVYNILGAIKNHSWQIFIDQVKYAVFPTGVHHAWMRVDAPLEVGPTWFLMAMFWCKVCANYLLSKKVREEWIFLIALAATVLDRYVITLPLGFLTGLSAMMFFIIGYYFARNPVKPWLAALCIICWPICFTYSGLAVNASYYKLFPLDILGACGGTLVVYGIAKWIDKNAPISSKVWSYLGRNSLTILCIHALIRSLWILDRFHLPETAYFQIPLELFLILSLTYLCSKIPFTRRIFQVA